MTSATMTLAGLMGMSVSTVTIRAKATVASSALIYDPYDAAQARITSLPQPMGAAPATPPMQASGARPMPTPARR